MDPKVSVIMPTLNVDEFITKSVSAILNQSFSDFELIIVDGGSTDNTLSYIDQIEDERIQVFENCGGIVDSLNKGIDEAQGNFIARADADTIPRSKWINTCVDFLNENPDYAAIGTQAKRIYSDGTVHTTCNPQKDENIDAALVWENPMVHPTMMIRTSMLKEVGGYRQRHWEDYDLVIRLARNYKLANTAEVLVTDYARSDSLVRKTPPIKFMTANLRCSVFAIRTGDYSYSTIVNLGLRRTAIAIIYMIYNMYTDRIKDQV